MADPDDDPWGFAAPKRPRLSESTEPGANSSPTTEPESAVDSASGGPPVAAVSDGKDQVIDPIAAIIGPRIAEERPTASAARGSRLEATGEVNSGQRLRQRAWALAVTVFAVYGVGFLVEVVAASQFVSRLGSDALVIIYGIGAFGLIAVALLQMTWIDRIRRDKAVTRVTFGYAVAFVVALVLLAIPAAATFGSGALWLLADQLNFLLPLVIWAVVGDLFNAGEGRRIFPWITSWSYAGQILGFAVPTVAPLVTESLGLPLWGIAVLAPIVCVAIGILLPRAVRDRSISRGHGRDQSVLDSLRDTFGFVRGVPALSAAFVSGVLVFSAGLTLEANNLRALNEAFSSSAVMLQVTYGATLTGVFIVCWLLNRFGTTRILERLNISGGLFVLPVVVIVAAAVALPGNLLGLLPFVIAAVVIWWVPRWTIDDVARRAALALVPDDKRARVSFVLDLTPFAVGLFVAAIVTWVSSALEMYWISPVVAMALGGIALRPGLKVIRQWDNAMLNPTLRRRKRLSDM